MGRTIPSFRMVMDQEIDRIMKTYGKKLPSKKEREELYEVLQLSKRHSHSCSEAVRLVPMHAMLLAIILEQGKMIKQIEKYILPSRVRLLKKQKTKSKAVKKQRRQSMYYSHITSESACSQLMRYEKKRQIRVREQVLFGLPNA